MLGTETRLKNDQQLIPMVSLIPYRAKLCRAKVTNFSKSDENFARRIVSPDKVSPDKVIATKFLPITFKYLDRYKLFFQVIEKKVVLTCPLFIDFEFLSLHKKENKERSYQTPNKGLTLQFLYLFVSIQNNNNLRRALISLY